MAEEVEKTKFEGIATRSKTEYRFDLVPATAIKRLALRYGLGAVRHGEDNWKDGGSDFIRAAVNHLEKHTQEFKENGNNGDDNLGAILWGAAALCWFEKNKPEDFKKALEKLG